MEPYKAAAGTAATAFLQPDGPNPHGGRARAIIQRHPEIRDLVGKNPGTFWITFGIVAVQTAVAGGGSTRNTTPPPNNPPPWVAP